MMSFFLGYQDDIKGSKLPSKIDALGYFIHLQREKKLTIREPSTAGIDKIAEFCDRACISMGHKNKMIEIFETFYHEY